jgi:hypothetical protein
MTHVARGDFEVTQAGKRVKVRIFCNEAPH